MTQPRTPEEYARRFHANQKITGNGIEGVRTHVPCPFCAAPDWLVHGLLEVGTAYAAGATCEECGRTARAIYYEGPSSTAIELVQTGGDPPEPWAPLRRATPEDFPEPAPESVPVVNTDIMATVPDVRTISVKPGAVYDVDPGAGTFEERAPETKPSPSSE